MTTLYISLLKAYTIVVLQVVYVVQLQPFVPPKDRINYYNSRIAEFQWVSGRSIKDSENASRHWLTFALYIVPI